MSFTFDFGNDAAGNDAAGSLSMSDLGASSGMDAILGDQPIATLHQDRRVQAFLNKNRETRRIASLEDIQGFAKVAGGSNGNDHVLVHKAERDLWKLSKDDKGYYVERLFNETGDPLKV